MKIVIVGGGAAGATAAQFARKQDRKVDITVFEGTGYPQYSRCGLPYALSGKIPSFDSLVEFSTEWFQRNRINLHLNTRVTGIDTNRKSVETEGPNGKKETEYDSLIFATGASATVLNIQGIQKNNYPRKGVFLFRGMDDAKTLRKWCDERTRTVVIIGSSLVGLECAESLHELGHEVTIVKRRESVLQRMIDNDMADPLITAMKNAGIELRTICSIEAVLGEEAVQGIRIRRKEDDGVEEIACDTILLGTGQAPNSSLAEKVGCDLSERGHIKVDSRCETSVKGVFAVGDCSAYKDIVTGRESPAFTGTMAVKMGKVAGINASGGEAELPDGFLKTRVTKLFGLEIAAVGPISSELSESDLKFVQSRVKGSTLPTYYPGGKELLVKIVASLEDGKLLSCQVVGEEGCALRATAIGGMILGGLRAEDLAMLETAYAPPVAPTVDVLAAAAEGILIKLRRSRS